jgi:D-alanine transaminase
MARLQRSAEAISLPLPRSLSELAGIIRDGIARAQWPETKVYVQLTRGAAPRDHGFPVSAQPTLIMTFREMHPLASDVRIRGVDAITMPDLRWGRCDIKSVNLLANVLARQRAKEAGVFEAIFVHGDEVTEGAVSNVLLVRDGRLITPPEGPAILSGVTRGVVLTLARKDGIPVDERSMTRSDLAEAQEVLLTGTTVEVIAVVRVDGAAVGTGRPGPIASRLHEQFSEYVRKSL